jgi:YD repeat-containing protein
VAPQGADTTRKGDVAAGTVVTSDTWNADGQLATSSVASTSAGPGNSGKTDTATVSTTNTYDYGGHLASSGRSDGAATSYRYDGLGRTVGMTLPDRAASGAGGSGGKPGNGGGSGKAGGPGCGNGGSTPGWPGGGG